MKSIKRIKEDKGASNTISFMFIIFFSMIILISFLDIGIYFNAKTELKSAAENGARNVALYGGTNDNALRTSKQAVKPVDVVKSSIKSKYTSAIVKTGDASSSKTVISINPNDIQCGPDNANAGSPVNCSIEYTYNGIAGPFSLFSLGVGDNKIKVYGTAVSEVNMKE